MFEFLARLGAARVVPGRLFGLARRGAGPSGRETRRGWARDERSKCRKSEPGQKGWPKAIGERFVPVVSLLFAQRLDGQPHRAPAAFARHGPAKPQGARITRTE